MNNVKVYVKPELFGPFCTELPKDFLYYLANITFEGEEVIGGKFATIYKDDLKCKVKKQPSIPGALSKKYIERIEDINEY